MREGRPEELLRAAFSLFTAEVHAEAQAARAETQLFITQKTQMNGVDDADDVPGT